MSRYADEPWFKIQRRVFDSSVWEEDLATRIVWVTLLALAQLPENRKHGHGTVAITPGNLLRKAYVSAEEFAHAIKRLTGPDPSSRTNPGGARLEVLPNGYRITGFEEYHDAEEYDLWHAQRVAAGRARAESAKRSAEASGKGGRGRFTSDEPATAGNLPASPLVRTRITETYVLPPARASRSQPPTGGGGGEPHSNGNGNGATRGPGAATAKELARLEVDPVLADVGDSWAQAFNRPRREIGVLRAAKAAVAGGYSPEAMKLVIRLASIARENPERFPDRGSIRWAVEHGKAGDPSYLLRPSTLDRLIPEAEQWEAM